MKLYLSCNTSKFWWAQSSAGTEYARTRRHTSQLDFTYITSPFTSNRTCRLALIKSQHTMHMLFVMHVLAHFLCVNFFRHRVKLYICTFCSAVVFSGQTSLHVYLHITRMYSKYSKIVINRWIAVLGIGKKTQIIIASSVLCAQYSY